MQGSNMLRNMRMNLISSWESSNMLRNMETNLIGSWGSSNMLRNMESSNELKPHRVWKLKCMEAYG